MKNRVGRDFTGFIHQDTAWLDLSPRDEQGKVHLPAYSHIYTQKKPSQPLNNLIFKKIKKYQEEKMKKMK
jgi:hypothetical protein